jgi:GNAT superfamily N-acetyltransferase
MNMIIRKGEPADMPAVLALIQELAVFEREPNAVVVTAADLVRDGFKENPLFYTFVAEVQGKIVGMALYYFRYSTWKGKTIHLEDLILNEQFRKQRIGFALYHKVIEAGYHEGVRRIEWNVLDWNRPAIDFYQKTGAKVFDDWRVAQLDEMGIQNFIKKYTKQ